MTYLEALELIKKIENEYDVMSIRFKSISVWPYLRLYLLDQISVRTELKASSSVIRCVLKGLFAYNPFSLFKRRDLWIFTACERRKLIGNKMIHRVSGVFSSLPGEYLMLEKPGLHTSHYKRENIEEKDIVSESWLLVLFHFLKAITRFSKPKIENEGLIRQLLTDNNLVFDYYQYIRALNAKRLSLLWMLKFMQKPKLAIMECPYNAMGYMWAFHQKGVKVLELQHGVAGRSHNAYNGKAYEPVMNPDGICVYGIEEYNYFTKEEPQYATKVYMTGLYMLEKADEIFNADVFASNRREYDAVVVCSGQKGYEEQLSLFVDNVALENKKCYFVYIPRDNNTELFFSATNVEVARNVNIYQYLKWADIHMTISSTTCLEAQYFHTPTVFYDYNNMSSTYYGDLLKLENGAIYILDPAAFLDAYLCLKQNRINYLEVFAHDHMNRMKSAIEDMKKRNRIPSEE